MTRNVLGEHQFDPAAFRGRIDPGVLVDPGTLIKKWLVAVLDVVDIALEILVIPDRSYHAVNRDALRSKYVHELVAVVRLGKIRGSEYQPFVDWSIRNRAAITKGIFNMTDFCRLQIHKATFGWLCAGCLLSIRSSQLCMTNIDVCFELC